MAARLLEVSTLSQDVISWVFCKKIPPHNCCGGFLSRPAVALAHREAQDFLGVVEVDAQFLANHDEAAD